MLTDGGFVKLSGTGVLTREGKALTKVEIFLKNSWICEVCLNFFAKTCFTNKYFSRDPHFVILAWVQSWNIFEILMKVCSPPEFFHKKACLTKNHLSCDPHYVILAWVQSWNISEILMKVCRPFESFHKNMSHEQLPLTWSTFRHSSMGTKFAQKELVMVIPDESADDIRYLAKK